MTHIAMVSGASSGIGAAITRQLAQSGWTVLAGYCNTLPGNWTELTPGKNVHPVQLDFSNPDTLQHAVDTMTPSLNKATRLVLINNAGFVLPGPLEALSLDSIRHQFDVNVLGHLALTQALLPWCRNVPSRIIMMSSISGRLNFPMMGAYCASKHALESIASTLRMELSPWRIPIIVIAPGSVATPLWKKAFERFAVLTNQDTIGINAQYLQAFPKTRQVTEQSAQSGISPERISQVVIKAIESPRPKHRYLVTKRNWFYQTLLALPTRWRESLILVDTDD